MAKYGSSRYGKAFYGHMDDHPYANVPGKVLWRLQIDWDRDGLFGSMYEPQTFMKIKFRRGRKNRIRTDGKGQEHPEQETFWIEIYDPEGRYDSYNQYSPVYDYLGASGILVQLWIVSTTTYAPAEAVFTGTLTSITYKTRQKRAVLSGEGLSRYLQIGTAESPSTPIQPFGGYDSFFTFGDPLSPVPVNWWKGRTDGLPLSECVDLTLTQSGWPFGLHHGAEFTDDQPNYFYLDGSSAWQILKSLADGFAARLFFLRTGKLFAMDRQDSVGLLAEDAAPLENPLEEYGLERPSPFECVRNNVKIKVDYHTLPPFVAGYSDWMVSVWNNSGPIKVPAASTIYINAELRLNGRTALASWDYVQIAYLSSWSSPDKTGTDMNGDVGGSAVLSPDLTDARKIRFELVNSHPTLDAYVFNVDCYALVISKGESINTYQATDEASVAINGTRTLSLENPWIQDDIMADRVAQAYLLALSNRKRSSPATLAYLLSGDGLYQALVNYDLGTYVDFGSSGDETALENYGLNERQLIVGQEVEWVNGDGQDAIVKLTYESESLIEEDVAMGSGLVNGYVDVSVSSGNITVAIKAFGGADPTSANPVYIVLGNAKRKISSALTLTKNSGTNWFNAGSSGLPIGSGNLAACEIDYFVYLGYNATDGVTLGFARIPYASRYGEFSTTSTDENYAAITNISHASANDPYAVVGRFAASLSAVGSGYTWSVPTFTPENLVQCPIFETRWLSWNPYLYQGYSVAPSTTLYQYQIVGRNMCLSMHEGTAGTSNSTGSGNYSTPMRAKTVTNGAWYGMATVVNAGTMENGYVYIFTNAHEVQFYRGGGASYTASGDRRVNSESAFTYPIG